MPPSPSPANEIAKNLTGRDYVSWSAISTFSQCPLKDKFRYVDGLPEESVSSDLVFGTGIHSAIEQHFHAILSGDPKPGLYALLFAYCPAQQRRCDIGRSHRARNVRLSTRSRTRSWNPLPASRLARTSFSISRRSA